MVPRTLSAKQICQIWIHDRESNKERLLLETRDLLLAAPNWTLQGDALILNGEGQLWRIELENPVLVPINIKGLPPANNDHVLDPGGQHIFISTYDDWQIYRAPLTGGRAVQITGKSGPPGLRNFLHGVSPDGKGLTYVGVRTEQHGDEVKHVSAEICLIEVTGQNFKQVTNAGVPADGPEYSPDGKWIYFNTEAFSGHAQIARMRPDGSELTRLTFSRTADWFPHLSPNGKSAVFLAYPEGVVGHPADKWVDLKVVHGGDWKNAQTVVRIFGGQGTINVNSWSPDSRRFAYVSYPTE